MKKKFRNAFAVCLVALTVALVAVLGVGCGGTQKYIVSIEAGQESGTYIVTYSDGETQTMVLPGKDGRDGKDGKDVTITDIYETYVKETGEDISYSEFIDKYLSLSVQSDNSATIAQCLRSVGKVYAEFVEQVSGSFFGRPVYDIAIYTGAAVVWSMDEAQDGYTYFVTNAHVIYDSKAVSSENDGKIARKVVLYMYGSESSPYTVDGDGDGRADADENGYTLYDYGDYGIECEIVGYTFEKDLAVIKAKTDDVKKVNPNVCAVELADEYHVGETAIAIGNPDDGGISVTEGIVSVDNDDIELTIDAKRTYRSIRMDTALYGGNSGGGLFNSSGKLIGIANAGSTQEENINYAIPLEIVRGTVENILYWDADGSSATSGAYKVTLGVTVLSSGSKYIYDSSLGYGKIVEDVVVRSVVENSIASRLGLSNDDVITAVVVNEKKTEVKRSFDISDIILTMRPGDEIAGGYTRGGETYTSESYTLASSDFEKLA